MNKILETLQARQQLDPSKQPAAASKEPVTGAPSSTGNVVNSTASRIARVKELFTGQGISGKMSDVSDLSRVQTIAADAAADMLVDFHDMRDLTGKQFALENMIQLSVQQLDTYIEPVRVMNQIVANHVPSKLTMTPIIMSFDESGAAVVNGEELEADPTIVGVDSEARIGWLLVVKRRDVLKGRTTVAINNNDVFIGTYEVADADKEGRVALLPSTVDTVLHMNGGGAQVKQDGNIEVDCDAQDRQLSAYINFMPATDPSNRLTVTGINAYVYAYCIPFTRETNDIIAASYVADAMDTIAGELLHII